MQETFRKKKRQTTLVHGMMGFMAFDYDRRRINTNEIMRSGGSHAVIKMWELTGVDLISRSRE